MSAVPSSAGARPPTRRRFFVPEVVQTSGMDCGPAALKSLLEGFGVAVSYGRLREACHTDVDGTSIDTLEEIAQALNLPAEQIMIPLDHVLLDEKTLPAIAVAQRPAGGAHFVVVWRRHGPFVQVMDPARGRLWLSRRALLEQLYRHTAVVSADAWRAWAGSDAFLKPLRHRLKLVGLSTREASAWIQAAQEDSSWQRFGQLDAGVRMLRDLIRSGALTMARGPAALRAALTGGENGGPMAIPDHYWSVLPVEADGRESTQLRLRGAVLVRVMQHPAGLAGAVEDRGAGTTSAASSSPELAAALAERPVSVLREVARALRASGIAGPALALTAATIATLGVVFEALLLRSVLDISALLTLPMQGLAAGGALAAFAALLLGIELVLASAERRAGSHLEARLRIAFLEKMPRLADSYFQSRPVSDMLERSHGVHVLRTLPPLAIRTLRVAAELVVTTAAIIWLDPRTAAIAIGACTLAALIPFAANSLLAEGDLKVRTHAGALARFHLDALLGRTAIEAHGAESTIEREHDRLLAEWAHASVALQRKSMSVEGVQMLVGFGLAGWLLFGHFASGITGAMLLMTYWVLNLPALGYELALNLREFPAHRSVILRLLEPLGAPDSVSATTTALAAVLPAIRSSTGVNIDLRGVSVHCSGHQVLEGIDLQVEAGGHIAIVGASGAGKSTLVGLLLGWHRASGGELLVDGRSLDDQHLNALRGETAWVDPGVQIFNRSLLENLLYGTEGSAQALAPVLEAAALMPVIAKLPEGLATPLGEGGALLSAGERQRVRLGRAMMRDRARLVILDEPFLGLEKDRRRALLAQVRQRWAGSTLLYVTHDVAETRGFDRVVVMERGRLMEDGEPLQLAQIPASRYRRLLQVQETVHARLTTGAEWRRVRLESGRISHEHGSSLEQRA